MRGKRRVVWGVGCLLLLWLGLLGGCSLLPELEMPSWSFLGTPTPEASATPEPAPTPVSSEPPQMTATPASQTAVLEFWVPGFLYADAESPVAQLLTAQVNRYAATLPDVRVRISAKKDTGVGGLYNLISTAADVAPSMVPDLVLINQHDLIAAADAGLLQQLGDVISPDLDYFATALSAVTTTQGIWAFPYVAQAEQMAYAVGITETAPLSWTAVLSGSYQMLLPAGPPEGVATDALLSMYLAAGGRTMDQAGQATLDRITLERLYGFVAEMRDAGLLDVDTTLSLTDARAGWTRYQEGLGHLTPVPMGVYWAVPQPEVEPEEEAEAAEQEVVEPAVRESAPSWVPSPDGAPMTILHTWGLAVLADDPLRRDAALGLVQWLVSAQRMGDLARGAELVPTHRQAVAAWSLPSEDLVFVNRLLSHSVRACPPAIDLAVRRALQAGLSALLLQEVASPEQAASFALTSLRR